MNRKGKEAGEFTMFSIFMFVIVIIGAGIAADVAIFFGGDLDYRSSDSSLLYTKIARCLSENELNSAFLNDIYKNCKISEKVIADNKFVINLHDSKRTYFSTGDPIQCELQAKNIDYPRCSSGKIMVNMNGAQTELSLTTGSNQEAKNAK